MFHLFFNEYAFETGLLKEQVRSIIFMQYSISIHAIGLAMDLF